jgi:hypothetical protein
VWRTDASHTICFPLEVIAERLLRHFASSSIEVGLWALVLAVTTGRKVVARCKRKAKSFGAFAFSRARLKCSGIDVGYGRVYADHRIRIERCEKGKTWGVGLRSLDQH